MGQSQSTFQSQSSQPSQNQTQIGLGLIAFQQGGSTFSTSKPSQETTQQNNGGWIN